MDGKFSFAEWRGSVNAKLDSYENRLKNLEVDLNKTKIQVWILTGKFLGIAMLGSCAGSLIALLVNKLIKG